MSEFDWAWAAWLGFAGSSFAVIEAIAIQRSGIHGEETLTSTLRRWTGIEPKRPWAMAGVAGFMGFGAWLGLHLGFGILP